MGGVQKNGRSQTMGAKKIYIYVYKNKKRQKGENNFWSAKVGDIAQY